MWERINKFTRSHSILVTLLMALLFITALTIFAALQLHIRGMDILEATADPTVLMFFTMWQIVLSVIAIWLMRKMHVFNINDFRFKKMGQGFLLGWFNIVFAIGAFFFTFMSFPENSLIAPNPVHLLTIVFHQFLGTGPFEEILVRGLILKILLLTMGHSKKGIINACLLSSAIFGVAHIVNIIHGTGIFPVVGQIIYAAFIGVFYAALFLRTKTLWVPILLHGLTNVSTQIFNAIVSPDIMQSQPDPSIIDAFMPVVFALPFLLVGLILLRKVKTDDAELLMVERTKQA
jgi:membrane protease YdiL (CAAX protease family)